MKNIILYVILSFLFSNTANAQMQSIKIDGIFNSLKKNDTVSIKINKHPELPPSPHLYEVFNVALVNNKLQFSFTTKAAISLIEIFPKSASLPGLGIYLEKGKSLGFVENNGKYNFYGKNANQYSKEQNLRELSQSFTHILKKRLNTGNLDKYLTAVDSSIIKSLDFLSKNKSVFSKDLYDLWESNIVYGVQGQKNAILLKKASTLPPDSIVAFRKIYEKHEIRVELFPKVQSDSPEMQFRSTAFPFYVYNKYSIDSCFFTQKPFSESKYLDYINQKYSGKLAVRLSLYLLVYQESKSKDNLESYIKRLISVTKDPFYRSFLINLKRVYYDANVISYVLTDQNGKKVNLNSYLGKVIVFDFWYTGCGNCARMAPILARIEENYKNNKDVVFLSIAIDKLKKRWLESVASHRYSSPLSTNFYTSGKGSADPMIQELNIQSFPTMFIIDKRGHLTPNFNDLRVDNGEDFINKLTRVLKD
ncbi:TlpA disulfide reductase family protein [Mucilaginibacter sp. cycad4]|uniref:TlpA family protein disulfide reductase n=1 Tax=Mucilaginibacter sp. cycad4 TaxID=3342096 RepID=UPI002AABC9FF|nr:TlpA disulfide reductase family protein [Mucilaginibacter gossypii]WPU99078.1 TlpA disulfide reductase family protein [Mucilaginibacter gossypii]